MPESFLRIEINISTQFFTPSEQVASVARQKLDSAFEAITTGKTADLKALLMAKYYTVTQEEFQSNYNAPQDTAAVSHLRRESEDHVLFGFSERRALIQHALTVGKIEIASDIFNDQTAGIDVRFKLPEFNAAFETALRDKQAKDALSILKAEAYLVQFEAIRNKRPMTLADKLSGLSKNLEAFTTIIERLGLSSALEVKINKMKEQYGDLQIKAQQAEARKGDQSRQDLLLLRTKLETQKTLYEEKNRSFSLPGQSSASQKLHEVKLMLAEVTRLEKVLKGEEVAALSRWMPGMAAKDGTLFKSELKPFADSLVSLRDKIETALAPRTSSEWVIV